MYARIKRASLIALLLMTTFFAFSQEEKKATLDIYLDCSSCDNALIRQQIDYINYTNDPFTAHVHLFITRLRLGSGGNRYQLKFIGKQDFEGDQISLDTDVPPNSSHVESQELLIKNIKMGLASFLANTMMEDRIEITIQQD